MTVIATTRDTVAGYVDALFLVYIVLIFIRVLMSWFTRIPYYLNLFRRFIPLLRIGPGAIDLSPIVAIIVLSIVRTLVVNAIAS